MKKKKTPLRNKRKNINKNLENSNAKRIKKEKRKKKKISIVGSLQFMENIKFEKIERIIRNLFHR